MVGSLTGNGYLQVSVGPRGGATLLGLHRVKFCLRYGWLPEQVDHRDGDRTNNRLSNLRPTSYSGNRHNRRWQKAARSLPRGVRVSATGKISAVFTFKGVRHYLGTFANAEEASQAVEAALRRLHGEFYRTQRRSSR